MSSLVSKDKNLILNFRMKRNSENFFVAITALSLFIIYLLFLEGEKKGERESNGDKSTDFCFITVDVELFM